MHLLIVWLVSAISLLITAHLVRGFRIRGFGNALVAAVVVGLANALLWPILIVLTLPLNILTLGLFTFVISVALLKLAAAVVDGFDIDGWMPAIVGAIVAALAQWILRAFISV